MIAKINDDLAVEEISGNVFENLGFPRADREQLKAQLMLEIYRAIKDRRLTQAQAGGILGIRQPHVSALMNGRSGICAVAQLFEFLNALGRGVEIAVRDRPEGDGLARTVVVIER